MQEVLQPRGPFRNIKDILLASASPRRQELLQRLGINFQVRPSQSPEPEWEGAQKDPEDFAVNSARQKALDVQERSGPGVVIAADTVISLDGEILGKAKDSEQALAIMQKISGRSHQVITGCYLADREGAPESFSVCTRVNFAEFEEDTLAAYVRTGEFRGKAGAYAIQGVGAFLVAGINGSYTNVVGLPLQEVLQTLLRMKAVRTEEEE